MIAEADTSTSNNFNDIAHESASALRYGSARAPGDEGDAGVNVMRRPGSKPGEYSS